MSERDIRCPSCGSVIDEDDLFCANCGTESSAEKPAAAGAAVPADADPRGSPMQFRVPRLRGLDELRRRGQGPALPLLRLGRAARRRKTARYSRPASSSRSPSSAGRPSRRCGLAGQGLLAATGLSSRPPVLGNDPGLRPLLGLSGRHPHLLDRRFQPHAARCRGDWFPMAGNHEGNTSRS